MLTDAFLNAATNYVKGKVSFAKYRIGDTWYRANTQAAIRDDNRVAISFEMMNQTGALTDTVNGIQICDFSGTVIAERTASIQINSGGSGVFYQMNIAVSEI